MATYQNLHTAITLDSSGTLADLQYFLTTATTASADTAGPNTFGRTSVVATRGGFCYGVIQDNSTFTGFSTKVAVLGVSKVAAGDTSAMENAITYGTKLISSSVGRAVPSTAAVADYIFGVALTPLATGATATITALINHIGTGSTN